MKNEKRAPLDNRDNRQKELDKINTIDSKLDIVLNVLQGKPNGTKYMTAQQIEQEFGIDQRTILNRSNLSHYDKRFIPSLTMKGRRKYFERKVIERLLTVNK